MDTYFENEGLLSFLSASCVCEAQDIIKIGGFGHSTLHEIQEEIQEHEPR